MIFSRLTLLVISAALSATNAHYHHDWSGGEGEGWGYHHKHGDWKNWKKGLRGDKGGHGDGGHGGRGHGGHGGHGGRGGKGAVAVSVEKGFKCVAGGFGDGDESAPEDSGALKAFNGCEGGEKKTYPERSHPHAIAADAAKTLQEHMTENLIPSVSDLMPPSDTFVELMDLTPENLVGLQEGESRSVKFGGKSEMTFECNISVTMKDGKPVKTSECGFKTHGHMGKKDAEAKLVLEAVMTPKVEAVMTPKEPQPVEEAQLIVTEEVKAVMEKLEDEEEFDSSEEVEAEIKD